MSKSWLGKMPMDEFEKECVSYVCSNLQSFTSFYENSKEGVYP